MPEPLTDLPFDRPTEECGIFGIVDHPDASVLSVLGLNSLQHRGQEAAGIVGLVDGNFRAHRGHGLVGSIFYSGAAPVLPDKLTTAIAHCRYSTSGDSRIENVQPFTGETAFGAIALAHNGNLTNGGALRKKLLRQGRTFHSTSDTEVVLHLIAQSQAPTFVEAIKEAADQLEGAFSLLIMTAEAVYALRDPSGVRPLVLGRLDGSAIVASETCALDALCADFERDLEPGEILRIDPSGVQSFALNKQRDGRFCIFEYIYFMRPNSHFDGKYVSNVRERIGAELFRESHCPADVVMPVPDSGVHAAVGYAETANVPYKQGIIRSHYVGRTFIEPTEQTRHLSVRLKLSVNRASVLGRRVILIDDSIVRGTTMPKIVEMLRHAGAAEVHVRISSPPFAHPCFYGIDTPTRSELAAARHSVDEITTFIGADSLAFVSLDGLYRAVGSPQGRQGTNRPYCDACFTGDHGLSTWNGEVTPSEYGQAAE